MQGRQIDSAEAAGHTATPPVAVAAGDGTSRFSLGVGGCGAVGGGLEGEGDDCLAASLSS